MILDPWKISSDFKVWTDDKGEIVAYDATGTRSASDLPSLCDYEWIEGEIDTKGGRLFELTRIDELD